MLLLLFKGFLIGFVASVSMGPVAMQVLRKSLNYGKRAGTVTGMGAGLGDTTFAAISLVAYAVAQNFIDSNRTVVYLVCGLIITVFGVVMVARDPFRERGGRRRAKDTVSISFFGQGLITDLSNPGALVVMMTLFGFFKINPNPGNAASLLILPCVYAGTVTYWRIFSVVASKVCENLDFKVLRWVNRVMGSVVVCLGLYLMAKGFI